MLRIYQLPIKHISALCLILSLSLSSKAQQAKRDSISVQYKIGFSGILDKSLVTRLILSTQNNFVIRNKWTSFEPILNYRFGYVQPNGLNKVDLENDFFIQLKNHFLYQKQFFPSAIAGFENSPNIRRLDSRYYAGFGVGSYVLKKKTNQLQIMLYGLYENSAFEALNYQVFRLMPFVKGVHFSEKYKVGISYNINPYLSPWSKDNWRFRGNIRPFIKITPKLDFSISYELWYESLVSGIQPEEISVWLVNFNFSNFNL